MRRLKRIEIEGFRGFASRSEINLDADAVLVTGANGLGKTSLTDALVWGLTGALDQMSDRHLRTKEEYVVNQFLHKTGGVAEVRIALETPDGEFVARRKGSSIGGSTLTVETDSGELDQTESEARLADALGLSSYDDVVTAVRGWGVLRQDAIRAVLSAKPEEFQERLRDILGLGVLADFEESTKRILKERSRQAAEARKVLELAERQLSEAVDRLSRAQSSVTETIQSGEATKAVVNKITSTDDAIELRVDLSGDVEVADGLIQNAAEVEASLRNSWIQINQLQARVAATDLTQPKVKLAEARTRLAANRAAASSLEDSLKAVESAVTALKREANTRSQLAALALPLLDAKCPVCKQPIDRDEVKSHLDHLLEMEEGGTALAEATEGASRQRESLESLQLAVATDEEIERAILAETAAADQRREALSAQSLLISSLADQPHFRLKLLDAERDFGDDEVLRTCDALSVLAGAVSEITRINRRTEVASRVPRLKQELDAAQAKRGAAQQSLEAEAKLESQAKTLADAATGASLDVTEEALRGIGPYFGSVFERLASHPTFRELGLAHDVYYGKAKTWARLRDPVTEIEVNPQIVASEGQLNVVAISFFLAFAMTAGSKSLPFVILDDPLQSMDDMNVLGFADLCRHLRDEKQLIVTTHDERFGALLSRKLEPRRAGQALGQIEFSAWDRSGPMFVSSLVAP